MGVLDDAVNEANKAVPGGDFTKPLLIAAGALLLGKIFGGRHEDPPPAPAPQTAPDPVPSSAAGGGGGLLGSLGSLLAGAAGGAISSGALSGGLGSLVDQFKNAGLGQQAESWVGNGQNLPISADQINSVVGQGKIAEIAQQAGIDPAQLSQVLAQALPTLIDKLTPGGQVPRG